MGALPSSWATIISGTYLVIVNGKSLVALLKFAVASFYRQQDTTITSEAAKACTRKRGEATEPSEAGKRKRAKVTEENSTVHQMVEIVKETDSSKVEGRAKDPDEE